MRRSPLLLLLLLSAFAWVPLLAPGYFLRAHDAGHSLFWLVEFDQAIRDGFLYPRWAPDHSLGYGYPLWIFYAPLAFYVAEFFHLLGFGIAAAIKITWALAFMLSGVTMYRFARKLWGPGPGLIAGLLYVYAPYHLVNIYVRAALAEFVAFALFPWVLQSFWELLEEGGRRKLAIAALSFGLTLLTHSVTVIFFPPVLALMVLYWLILRWRRTGRLPWRTTLEALAAGLAGIGLAAIFLLPALTEGRYIAQEQWVANTYNFADQFLYLFQLFSFDWGFGHALAGPNDGMPLQIGLWLALLGLAALPLLWHDRPSRKGELLGFLLAGISGIALVLAISRPVWEAFSPLALLQFPFRLLTLAALFLSLVAAGVVAALSARGDGENPDAGVGGRLTPTLLVLALAIVLASHPFTRPEHTPVTARDQSPQAVIDFELEYPDMVGRTAFAAAAPGDTPKVAAYLAGKPLPLARITAGEGNVRSLHHGAGSEQVQVAAQTPVTLQFYTYYYPGWRATVDGRETEIRPDDPYALITLDLPAGTHDVGIRLGNTPLRTLAAIISALTLGLLLTLFLSSAMRKIPGKAN
ncbi:MAG TPA: hypothetical protein G4N94_03905 [Caldilineae bacterium]|nr:hypothetical protein [Caldilineae bacterium]